MQQKDKSTKNQKKSGSGRQAVTDDQLDTLIAWLHVAEAFRDHQWQPCPECQALDGAQLCDVGKRLIEARSLAAVRAQKVIRDLQKEKAGR